MSKTIPSRYASRSTNDITDVLKVLNETLFCTISYSEHNHPFSLPTGFCVVDNQLIIHGSVKSHFLDILLKVKEVCITTFLFDGLVLATSAFEHSVNYRSTVIFSKAQEITEKQQKLTALKAFTEKYVPERWDELRPITDGEIDGTKVIAFSIENASVKQRTGPPSFKKDEWFDRVWTGEIPAKIGYQTPVQNPLQKPFNKIPNHIENLLSRK